MSGKLKNDCTRVPVTALSCCGPFLVAAEGPFLRFYSLENQACLASEHVFQAQAIHGICAVANSKEGFVLVTWGGSLLRAVEISASVDGTPNVLRASTVVKAGDWLLDLQAQRGEYACPAQDKVGVCAAVTAHNALLEVTVSSCTTNASPESDTLLIAVNELTSSSRSILYSAHVLWESSHRILVAAGTAFGEIMYWSWTQGSNQDHVSHVHCVFLGHEGSIFGVQISKELYMGSGKEHKRLLASCSDDRTIRIWDISGFSSEDDVPKKISAEQRSRHTGFSNASFDTDLSSQNCLAVGWGHVSRVWAVRFLEQTVSSDGVSLLSFGEDATSRIWKLQQDRNGYSAASRTGMVYNLVQFGCSSNHSGKNVWSSMIYQDLRGDRRIITGGADSKIAAYSLYLPDSRPSGGNQSSTQFTVDDLLLSTRIADSPGSKPLDLKKGKPEFFRSYTFISDDEFLLTTNLGKVYTHDSNAGSTLKESQLLSASLGLYEDLAGYSACTGVPDLSVAIVAGSKGVVYFYSKSAQTLIKLHNFSGKVGEIFVAQQQPSAPHVVTALVTLVGQDSAQLLQFDTSGSQSPNISTCIAVPLASESTGSVITSMAYIPVSTSPAHLLLGFRKGSIAIYLLPTPSSTATLSQVLPNVHAKEAVTHLLWAPSSPHNTTTTTTTTSGTLLSTGRNGHLTLHTLTLHPSSAPNTHLTHSLALPLTPTLEGLHLSPDRHILAYGFSSKKFVLYDTTAEEELLSVDTGGAHRSWAFQPSRTGQGGTLVWTRAASMHVYRQLAASHAVIRAGGHGREIKAVAVCPRGFEHGDGGKKGWLIATGAEDTDIKISAYDGVELKCLRTLRRHTTGVQALMWSRCGGYLFSSGGCEEFYVWRVSELTGEVGGGVGVVCEGVYEVESADGDLRIMRFDVRERNVEEGGEWVVAMVFSNSEVKVYAYTSQTQQFQPLAKGTYTTSCLTQAVFLSPTTLLTAGTDGYTALWPLTHPPSPPPSSTITFSTTQGLTWFSPQHIHQSSAKTLASHSLSSTSSLIASGGDDGSLALLLARTRTCTPKTDINREGEVALSPPTIVRRAHASAVTACAILPRQQNEGVYVLTAGNDQWVRLWEVGVHGEEVEVRRVGRTRTSVADVSSMGVLAVEGDADVARVVICGVGVEIMRVERGNVEAAQGSGYGA